ncbi:alpha/beta fold hydrolase [Piscinibacter sp.]|uniref:alpha/beta fold hydrolase n=1 Tax=Piscinibacter sp. TaxID=1903157 RepID=UPI002F3F2E62
MGKQAKPASGNNAPEMLAAAATEGMLGPNPFVGLRVKDLVGSAGQFAGNAARNPMLVIEEEAALARELISVLAGRSELAPAPGDKRFQDEAWKSNPLYRRYAQAYLAWSKALTSLVERAPLDDRNRERARFVVSLWTQALSPSNTLIGNPAALKRAVDTGGGSLVKGLRNMLRDLARNKGMPSQVDTEAFELGRNLALSPGSVVFSNPVLELIQYAPSTETVHARPQLIVPPQINKFYIFDLSPGRSIVEHLVNSGLQVFAVSWRNPTVAQRDWDLDTYVAALIEAIEAVREITGSADVNLHGACSGAMTMAALMGHLAAKKQKLVHAATLMVAVLDIGCESQLGLFATPEAMVAAKQNSRLKGVLKGQEMGRVFAWMRPNDLVWNYWVNNYLMGNPPPAFDLLYWNNDSTRLAAKFHGELLDIFSGNLLATPGAMKVLGTKIDLTKVDCDKYIVAGNTDHITPWKGVYRAASAFGGRNDFVLSSSGHIQSLINPPGNPKAKFFVNSHCPASADEWLADAKPMPDSWWGHWSDWLAQRSGERIAAPTALGSLRHPPTAKAPGRYVLAK